MIKHKNHIRLRETVCGIEYDTIENLWDFVINHRAGHWRRVTCKTCLKRRKDYEKELRKSYG